MPLTLNPYTGKPFSAAYQAIRSQAQALPVSEHMPRLLQAIRNHQVTVIVGETGSGKSTQTPQAILEALSSELGDKMVCLTQPRRLAAQSVAERIAKEMDVPLGTTVGLKHRGRNDTCGRTRIEVHTDGTTVAMAKGDPLLSKYGVVVIDEAHQHSIPSDVLLGLLKQVLNKRKDLRVVIMSATIDADLFINYLPNSKMETVQGRQHKVTMKFLEEPTTDVLPTIVDTVFHVHRTSIPGDILVFVSGVREITKVIRGIEKELRSDRFRRAGLGPLHCYPLHSKLPVEEQDLAVHALPPISAGKQGRKIIVSTNIAETSITINGITHVIDSCLAKRNSWDPTTQSWSLREQPVSKAEIRQRAGRAGRTTEGICWVMCTERGYHEDLVEHPVPPILEADMLSDSLSILKLGESPVTFDYIIPPASQTLVEAFELLHHIGGINLNAKLLPRGHEMTGIPADVFSALTLLSAPNFDCADEIICILSMIDATQGGSHLFLPGRTRDEKLYIESLKKRFHHESGDHITLLHIYLAWRSAGVTNTVKEFLEDNRLIGSVLKSADRTRMQFLSIMRQVRNWGFCELGLGQDNYYTKILQALAAGNFLHVAKRVSNSRAKEYEIVRSGMKVSLSEHTDLGVPSKFNEWVIYNQCYNDPERGMLLRLVSSISPELLITAQQDYWWNAELFPEGHIRDGLLQILANVSGHDGFVPAAKLAPSIS